MFFRLAITAATHDSRSENIATASRIGLLA
jgi:hypothetical protein